MKKKSMKEIKLDRSEGVIRIIEHSKDFVAICITKGRERFEHNVSLEVFRKSDYKKVVSDKAKKDPFLGLRMTNNNKLIFKTGHTKYDADLVLHIYDLNKSQY
jgi:hypothetical protein